MPIGSMGRMAYLPIFTIVACVRHDLQSFIMIRRFTIRKRPKTNTQAACAGEPREGVCFSSGFSSGKIVVSYQNRSPRNPRNRAEE